MAGPAIEEKRYQIAEMILLSLIRNQRLFPFRIRNESNRIAKTIQPFLDTLPIRRLRVVQMECFPNRILLERQMDDRLTDIIHGRDFNRRIRDRHATQLNTTLHEPANEIVRIPGAGLAVTGDE